MRCPHCGDRETRVVDSRDLDDSATIRRRRECSACATRFTTYERVEAARLVIVKRDGARQEFDREKLASGLRKALTRRPVADDAAEQRRRRDRGRAALAGRDRGRLVPGRDARRWPSSASSTRSPTSASPASTRASTTSRRSSARSISLYAERGDERSPIDVRRAGKHGRWSRPEATMSVLSDRDIRAALDAGEIAIRPYDPADLQPSSVDLHLDRSFRVFRNNRYPYIDVRSPQPDLTEMLRVADDEAVRPPSGRVRPRPDAGMGRAPERSRRQARGKVVPGQARAADPLDRGLCRPGLEGQPDARAVERGEPADRPLLRDEDRPDLVLQDELAGRPAVRLAVARLEVPGPVGADGLGVPPRLRRRASSVRGGRATALNDAVDWRRDLGGGITRRPRPGGHVPVRRRRPVRARSADPLGSLGRRRARPREPAPPGAELPADRDAGRARPRRDRDRRSARRQDPRDARLRGPVDRPRPPRRRLRSRPRSTSSR